MKNQINKIVFVLLAAVIFSSCDYAQNNVQTLVTDDCGQTWELIQAGHSIPKRVGVCQYKITLPNAPMQGEVIFKGTFLEKVRATIDVDYSYNIVDAKKFIKVARQLGKPNSDSDDKSNSAFAFESAENSVIDKVIKTVANDMLEKEDIIEYDESSFEDRLFIAVNKELADRGIELEYINFVPVPDEQTKQAIDVATAMKIYKTNNLEDVGKAVIVAKASASKISVTTQSTPKTVDNE